MALAKACIKLRQWAANDEKIVADIDPTDRESGTQINFDDNGKAVKTLGLYWNHNRDTFQYKIAPLSNNDQVLTKRKIISESAQLFDPVGWVQPILVVAKMLIQELWTMRVQWDDIVEKNIHEK